MEWCHLLETELELRARLNGGVRVGKHGDEEIDEHNGGDRQVDEEDRGAKEDLQDPMSADGWSVDGCGQWMVVVSGWL